MRRILPIILFLSAGVAIVAPNRMRTFRLPVRLAMVLFVPTLLLNLSTTDRINHLSNAGQEESRP